jgi:hypothetical protein
MFTNDFHHIEHLVRVRRKQYRGNNSQNDAYHSFPEKELLQVNLLSAIFAARQIVLF